MDEETKIINLIEAKANHRRKELIKPKEKKRRKFLTVGKRRSDSDTVLNVWKTH